MKKPPCDWHHKSGTLKISNVIVTSQRKEVKMQICMVCDHAFERGDSRLSETREHFGTPCRETETICPNCGSDEIEDATACNNCGTIAPSICLKGGFCLSCRTGLDIKISLARVALLKNFSPAELEYIRDEMEGVIEI